MKLTTSPVVPIFLLTISSSTLVFAQSPPAISAHTVKRVPAPRSPQIKCLAYTGNAAFSLADCRMTADRITSYYSDGHLSKIVAEGHVTLMRRGTVKHAELKATGETATYTYETNEITLKDKVQLLKYEGSGSAFESQVHSVSYSVGDGIISVSLPQYELYDVGKVH